MRKDITGQRFGRLTAVGPLRSDRRLGVIWHCRCDCGGEKDVPAAYLLRGQTKSCGCIRREHPRRADITGQRFGRLVAAAFDHYNEKHQDCWLFRCDCGSETVLPAANVKWGHTGSCGCLAAETIRALRQEDVTGQRFSMLTAVSPTEQRDAGGSVIWECRCDCGNIAYYSVSVLRRGSVHSCGCLYKTSRASCSSHRRDMVEDTSISALIVSKGLRRNNVSGCTGVCRDRRTGKWIAYINFQKKRYFLGTFTDVEEAVAERRKAERRLHDPVIREKLACLSLQSQKKFREYLEQGKESEIG